MASFFEAQALRRQARQSSPYTHGLCSLTSPTTLNYSCDEWQEGPGQNEWRAFKRTTETQASGGRGMLSET